MFFLFKINVAFAVNQLCYMQLCVNELTVFERGENINNNSSNMNSMIMIQKKLKIKL